MNKQVLLLSKLSNKSSISELQKYIEAINQIRGFDDEDVEDKFHLLVEEIGELAKAIRKEIGLKIDISKSANYNMISEELADILSYILDIANKCNVDLFNAFKEKEKRNIERFWEKNQVN